MIEGRVAQVLNERELVINRGAVHGIARGMKFEILAMEPVRIVDPEDGTQIGEVDRPKVRVQVTGVHDKFSICQTYETKTVPGGAFNVDFSLARMFERSRVLTATLKAEDSSLPPPLSEEESFVKVGDRVRLIEDVAQPANELIPVSAAS